MVEYSPFYNNSTKFLFNDLFIPSLIDEPLLPISDIKGIDNSNNIISFDIRNSKTNFNKKLVKNIKNKKYNMEPIMAGKKISYFPFTATNRII